MAVCFSCLGDVTGDAKYHRRCLESLFGTAVAPSIDLELSQLYSLAATQMAGKMSISGAQEKVSLTLASDRRTLTVAPTKGRYILKPETSRFSNVPQNEQLAMQMARLLKIDVPPFALIELKDDSVAYIIKRFDRLEDGTKLAVEDFCQLAGKPLRDKYDGSAELCVRILRRHATEPLLEIQKLYRLLLFSWWMANGDMHLKNFSVITASDGMIRLSPAYDLVCTELVIPGDTLAMPIGGRDKRITRRTWLDFASYCGLPTRAAERLISSQIELLQPALGLIEASFLPADMKETYRAIVEKSTATLLGTGG